MINQHTLVITSIANDQHPVLKQFAEKCQDKNIRFILIGDSKSPASFSIPGCEFYSLNSQITLPFKMARILPEKHYSRKNLGYLLAISGGCDRIVETDDDNYPLDLFWNFNDKLQNVSSVKEAGWLNVYNHFSDKLIWPRGFPLEFIKSENKINLSENIKSVNCPVQQGLANENPDVDAVYRLTYPLPFNFDEASPIALGKNSWSPFNSQNTAWFKEAFPLLYLPSYCSFRMTDIWRSFVVQRIAWEYDWHILFHSPTVYQERNEHSLLKDFEDELSGYLNNTAICKKLENLKLSSKPSGIYDNLRLCYDAIIKMDLMPDKEAELVEAWCEDCFKVMSKQ